MPSNHSVFTNKSFLHAFNLPLIPMSSLLLPLSVLFGNSIGNILAQSGFNAPATPPGFHIPATLHISVLRLFVGGRECHVLFIRCIREKPHWLIH